MYLRAVIKNGKGSLAVLQAAFLHGIKNMEKEVAAGRYKKGIQSGVFLNELFNVC